MRWQGLEDAIKKDMPLIYKIAYRYEYLARKKGVDFEDVVQAGVLGYMQAWERFDRDRGLAFSTLAFPAIKNSILSFLRDWNYVKMPRSMAFNRVHVVPIHEPLVSLTGDEATAEEYLGVTQDYTQVLVDEFLSTLSTKEQTIVILRLKGRTQYEIAQEIGCSQEYVSKRLKKIGKRLKQYDEGSEKDGRRRQSVG